MNKAQKKLRKLVKSWGIKPSVRSADQRRKMEIYSLKKQLKII
jgi:hypothetical protein